MACSKVARGKATHSAEPSMLQAVGGIVFDPCPRLLDTVLDTANRMVVPLVELAEDAAAFFDDATVFIEDTNAVAADPSDTAVGSEGHASDEVAALKKTLRESADIIGSVACVGVVSPLLTWGSALELGRSPPVELGSAAADPVEIVCVLAAVALASGAKSTLDQVPAERRLKKIQRRSVAALAASSALYAVLLLPHELVLPTLFRPELVLHCVSDAVAAPLFTLSLSALAGQKHWIASPAIAWVLMSEGTAAIAAADPLISTFERLGMLGLSYACALMGGRSAYKVIQRAKSEEDRQRSHLVCGVLSLSWVLSPVVQGFALFITPPAGIAPFVLMDVAFKCGIARILLCSRSSISAIMWQPPCAMLDRWRFLWGGGFADS